MASPAYNKRKGADWEISLRNEFRELGFDIERLHLNGADDEGDLVIRLDGKFVVIEAKNAKLEPSTFIKQMEDETENFRRNRGLGPEKVEGVVIVKRRGQSWRKALVLTTVERYFGLEDQS
ncbi:holliday junction resolvase [Streptomyces phage OzzyJ]|uniref:Holliday junction resolvase n=1 Tax=Streptomyces phage Werner TaxID=2801898 RepID=A0A7U0GCX4_9CAUD|nr:holliday junction resolvase [Streptomyces phage Werner]AVE00418.1 holliday junction resolvase [Streptomyces phage OzzyJ]QAY17717.1 holliday junction resolvase [Streptomyces phage Asten]QFP95203.1 holliday junction resolvase [Streptomyces phage Whatever]QQO39651.1 holliday junction resolvase [Streptomyces phage Hippo]QQO39958.1 holliday junction resolvase [Streptomyces phage Dwayne]QYW07220.1 holliday junction resolvase [Streptomyces phage Chucky]QYW07955.1 holliday junction resolvase [Str